MLKFIAGTGELEKREVKLEYIEYKNKNANMKAPLNSVNNLQLVK